MDMKKNKQALIPIQDVLILDKEVNCSVLKALLDFYLAS